MAQQAALREGARQERLEAKMERIAQEKKALTFNQKVGGLGRLQEGGSGGFDGRGGPGRGLRVVL